jgi:hypothetical protein
LRIIFAADGDRHGGRKVIKRNGRRVLLTIRWTVRCWSTVTFALDLLLLFRYMMGWESWLLRGVVTTEHIFWIQTSARSFAAATIKVALSNVVLQPHGSNLYLCTSLDDAL